MSDKLLNAYGLELLRRYVAGRRTSIYAARSKLREGDPDYAQMDVAAKELRNISSVINDQLAALAALRAAEAANG